MPAGAGDDRGNSCLSTMLVLVTVLFVALKLAGVIGWSWWWVFAPLLGLAAVLVLVCVAGLSALLVAGISMRRDRGRAVLATEASVTTSRRRGAPPAVTVRVRITLNNSAIDWSAVHSRDDLTGQVMRHRGRA